MKDETHKSGRPFAGSAIANYLDKQIDALKGVKSQRDIASEIGYEKPNMISMFKSGEARIPLDKIPALAKALHVDPAHLFRLALEQYWPDKGAVISAIFGTIASKNEEKILLTKWRAATENMDPPSNAKIEAAVDKMLKEALGKKQ